MLPLTLATEHELSEAVATRILAEFPSILIGTALRKNGYGYLRSRMRAFTEIARSSPVLVVTDLDTHVCPAALRLDWMGRLPSPPALLLRVAVREIESWLLADHDAMVGLFGTSARQRLPDRPDTLADPKNFLLDLARSGPRLVRSALRAEPGAVAKQGLGTIAGSVNWSEHPGVQRGAPNDLLACTGRWTGFVNVPLRRAADARCNLFAATAGATQAIKA